MRCVGVVIVVAVVSACRSAPQPPPRTGLGPSPGALAAVHAALDTQVGCNECHDGTKQTQDVKCIHCHDHRGLSARIAAGKGLHASPVVRGKPCVRCHREHAGRAFDLMGWSEIRGEASFDHSQTGWPLGGRADCSQCHSPTFKSMNASSFDHDVQARFSLDRHAKVACTACHANGELAARSCESCHALPARTPTKIAQSHHGHRFDALACTDCHQTRTWSPNVFAHALHTKLALAGKHATIACRACHRGKRPDDFERFVGTTSCSGCHAHRKVHADAQHPTGRYSEAQCLSCHQPERLPPL